MNYEIGTRLEGPVRGSWENSSKAKEIMNAASKN
jgi:hypothetical protein